MRFLLFFFIASSLCAGEIKNSIVPIVTSLEMQENLIPKKYSTAHYNEIVNALRLVDKKIRVSSFNMLFDIHDAKLDPENRWPQRFPRIVQVLESMQADIIGIQELQIHQIDQLLEEIGDTYEIVFIPNFDLTQKATRDYDGILYRKERLTLLDSQSFSVVRSSKNTLITMGHFLDLKTNKEFSVFNAHFPSNNPNEGERTAVELAQIIKPFAETGAVILTGDMNTIATFPDLQDLPWYGGERITALFEQVKLKNTFREALLGHVGPIATLTNVNQGTAGFKGLGTPGVMLDHIFVTKEFLVLIHAVDPVQVDGCFPSDHLPVFADIIQRD